MLLASVLNRCCEILDYVNEKDAVIGQAPRRIIHQKNLKHRASHLFIYYQDLVLLQLRHASKAQFPNCWDTSVGGHVNSGETYNECVLRETQEELGICCNQSLVQIAYYPASCNNGWEFTRLYTMHYSGTFILNRTEVSAVRWFTRREVKALLGLHTEFFAGEFSMLFNGFLRHRP